MNIYAKTYLLIVLSVTGQPALSEQTNTIKAFTTDGCSLFPDGTFSNQQLWQACCTRHDIRYWQGGTWQQRQQADRELQACVAKMGQPGIANIMLGGVRVGGSPFWPTSYRWGYGWGYLRGYKPLNEQEQQSVNKALQQYQANHTPPP